MSDETGHPNPTGEPTDTLAQDDAPQSFIEPNGTFKEGWIDAYVPEDLRHIGDYKTVTTVAQLAERFGHAKTLIGRQGKGIMPLAKDAGPTEKAAYYEALGRPKTPDDYKIVVPEGMEEVFQPDALKGSLEAMHGLGLTQEQAQGIVALDAARVKEAMTQRDAAQQAAYDEGVKTLKAEWGDAFKQKMHQANSVIEQAVPADKKEELLERWGNDLDLTRALSKMGELLLEDTLVDAGGAGHRAMTPEEMEAKAREIMQTPGFVESRLPEATKARLTKEIHDLFAKARTARGT